MKMDSLCSHVYILIFFPKVFLFSCNLFIRERDIQDEERMYIKQGGGVVTSQTIRRVACSSFILKESIKRSLLKREGLEPKLGFT